jgi:hypothetical protein
MSASLDTFGHGEVVGHVAWCGQFFESLNEGGVWGIPRAGLIFTKMGRELVLTEVMPWEEGMPVTADELKEQQRKELDANRAHFKAAGVEVVGEVE